MIEKPVSLSATRPMAKQCVVNTDMCCHGVFNSYYEATHIYTYKIIIPLIKIKNYIIKSSHNNHYAFILWNS